MGRFQTITQAAGRLGTFFLRILTFFRNVLSIFFGRLSWQPPGWLRFLGRKVLAGGRWVKEQPRRALGFSLLAAVVLAASGAGVRWYAHRPRPVELTVTVAAPGLTPVDEVIRPEPLLLTFEGSAAPLQLIGKVVASGVELSPRIDGTWRWDSDRKLSFAPKTDWPVGEEYTVYLQKRGLVADTVRLAEYKLKFKTAPFTVKIDETQFYQDVMDPNLKKVVASVKFSHPVDVPNFEKRISMKMELPEEAYSSTDHPPANLKFKVIYDKFKVHAYIHSDPIPVPRKDVHLMLTLEGGVRAIRGGPPAEEPLKSRVLIPGVFNFLHVQSAELVLADNERFEPEQVLVIETSLGVSEQEIRKSTSAYVLPLYHPDQLKDEHKEPYSWSDSSVVDAQILKQATPLKLDPIASEKEYNTLHSFRYQAPVGRYVYVLVKQGIRSFGGYVLASPYDTTAQVPEFPSQLKILHSGAILSMSGEKKVSIYTRDVPAIRFEVGRILPGQIHHLVSQNTGSFTTPDFLYRFGAENIAEIFTEVRQLPKTAHGKTQYQAFDLSRYLDAGGGGESRRGLFLFKAESYDPATKRTDKSDSRLILVTDLGLLVKDAADGSHDVFVQSIASGEPVDGARLEVIGKNGLQVLSATTDKTGHARFPTLASFKREQAPTLYLARKGGDMSFLPFSRMERYLDFSRFDVAGVTDRGKPQALWAYLFSDRGIYRPGDEIRVGMIVKSKDFQQGLQGVPLEVVITDARGLVVKKEKLRLSAAGFEEVRHTTQETSPTGTYAINVYVVKDGRPDSLLGSTSVRVQEFLPDRMKITAHLSSESVDGWVSPQDLSGRVTLLNLFGTPAAGRTVKASLNLSPVLPTFSRYRDFQFFDPLHAKEGFSDTLEDKVTSDEGEATFDLNLKRFAGATYRLRFSAQGFEAEGGRSVAAESSAIVSPLPYLVGYKADGDLRYLSRGSKRQVEIIAIGPAGGKLAVPDLKAALIERRYVSVLTKQDNGTYKYESVKKEIPISEKALSIPDKGVRYTLPTDRPGDFALVLRGGTSTALPALPAAEGTPASAPATTADLQRIEFSVAGQGNLTRSLEKNAELQITLKKGDFAPGEDIEMQIRAPYTGSGLITIERDKVYSYKWFKADTSSSVQAITLPEDFEGNGYVSVSFIRDVNSNEIFMSPLSYGVAPFSVSRERRTARVTLTSPDLARPGEAYRMRYQTDRPAKIVIFAVDEGILRVANYKTPDPLGYFFQKRALEVKTAQILDLVLPEFRRLMSAAPGGDLDGSLSANLNPFKRRRDKPVAYWSGIIDAGPKEREVSYQVPDSFNGTLHVMAVAVAPDALGAFDKRAHVRGDFVISPNAPTVAAPGDEFDVSVSVANNVEGSGAKAAVALELKTSKHLQVLGPARVTLPTAAMHEATTSFRLRATEALGSGSLSFVASLGSKSSKLGTDISVRPAVPYLTTVVAGHLRSGETDVPVGRTLYPEYRVQQAGISHLPLGLAHGLMSYLEKFPHGCTEQLVSQALPAIVLRNRAEFGVTAEAADRTLSSIITTLRARQNDEGGFGLWAANPKVSPFATVYALHFLLEARERGLSVPPEMLKSGMAYLQQMLSREGDSLAEQRLEAYAIYVMTRSGMVTSHFAAALQKRLEGHSDGAWKKDLAAAYLAATYRLLRQDRLANRLIAEYSFGESHPADYANYYDGLIHDAQLLYLVARHFPEQAPKVSAAGIKALVEPIVHGSYNTLSSAYTILALEAYGQLASRPQEGSVAIAEVSGDGQRRALKLPEGLFPQVGFSEGARSIHFASSGFFETFYLVTQAGFDTRLPAQPLKQKIEVYREYTDSAGKPVDRVKLGEELEVHLRLRALGGQPLTSVAIVDLLPGGFEVVVVPPEPRGSGEAASEGEGEGDSESAKEEGGESNEGEEHGEANEGEGSAHESGHTAAAAIPWALPIGSPKSTFSPEYGDVREDRVVLYGTAEGEAKEYVYSIKATNAGTFTVPPIKAESLYDRTVVAQSLGGKILVEKR